LYNFDFSLDTSLTTSNDAFEDIGLSFMGDYTTPNLEIHPDFHYIIGPCFGLFMRLAFMSIILAIIFINRDKYLNPKTLVLFLSVFRLAFLDLEVNVENIIFLFSEQSGPATGSGAGADSGSTGPDNGTSSNVPPSEDSSENTNKP
jgi:hypothetical protein